MRRLVLLVSLALAFLFQLRTALAQSQAFEHRWAGLVADSHISDDGLRLWTVEDGGRIRHRNASGVWSYQPVPDQVKDSLLRVFFVNGAGWAVGQNGWVLRTDTGGTSWTALFQETSLVVPSQAEELWDIHFEGHDQVGWLVGRHGVWYTTNGGLTESSWNQALLLDAGGAPLNTAELKLYAIDVVERDGYLLGLLVAEPGLILRSTNAQATTFQVVWDIHDLCGTGFLVGCEETVCHDPPAAFAPWDVEIRRSAPPINLALVVGGIGGNQCGYVVSSRDDGLTWDKEGHECQGGFPSPCDSDPLYNDNPLTLTDTWRHKEFKTLYGVAILDGDGSAVAAGYNGQHVVRTPGGLWMDRSSFSDRPVEAVGAVIFPLYGAVADGGTIENGTAYLTGAGGHVRVTQGNPQTWTDELPGAPWRVRDVDFVNASVGWQVGQFFRIARTVDGGANWSMQQPLPVLGTTGLLAVSFDPAGLNGVAVGSYDSRATSSFQDKPKILRTSDGGTSQWLEATTITTLPGTSWDFKTLRDVEYVSSGVFWAVGESGLAFRTTNGGATWSQHADPSMDIISFQKYEFEGVAFLDADNGVLVGWKQNNPGARALAFRRVGSVETWIDIGPGDTSITKVADVEILGTSAYAVGEQSTAGGRVGVILRSDYSGGSFGQFALISPHPVVPACTAGGDLARIPVLHKIAVNAGTGDIWVGGECGRVWRYTTTGGWTEHKSQTDGHVVGLSLTPSGHLYLAGYRQSNTQQVMTRWNP